MAGKFLAPSPTPMVSAGGELKERVLQKGTKVVVNKRTWNKETRLIVVGAECSGKSTLTRHFKLLDGVILGDNSQRQKFKSKVQATYVFSILDLYSHIEKVGWKCDMATLDHLKKVKDVAASLASSGGKMPSLSQDFAYNVKAIWDDYVFQAAFNDPDYKKSRDPATLYFMNKVISTFGPDYCPSKKDIIRFYDRSSTGEKPYDFYYDNGKMTVDVISYRDWKDGKVPTDLDLPYTVLFLVPLDSYDQDPQQSLEQKGQPQKPKLEDPLVAYGLIPDGSDDSSQGDDKKKKHKHKKTPSNSGSFITDDMLKPHDSDAAGSDSKPTPAASEGKSNGNSSDGSQSPYRNSLTRFLRDLKKFEQLPLLDNSSQNIVLLTREDIFRAKCRREGICCSFPEYLGGNDPDHALDYIKAKVRAASGGRAAVLSGSLVAEDANSAQMLSDLLALVIDSGVNVGPKIYVEKPIMEHRPADRASVKLGAGSSRSAASSVRRSSMSSSSSAALAAGTSTATTAAASTAGVAASEVSDATGVQVDDASTAAGGAGDDDDDGFLSGGSKLLSREARRKLKTRSAVCSELGRRKTNEDAHLILEDIKDLYSGKERLSFYAIYDGHGGSSTSHKCAEVVHKVIIARPEFPQDIKKAMFNGTVEADEAMQLPDGDKSGSTAVMALIHGKNLYVADLGDAECVVGVKDGKNGPQSSVLMTRKHNPSDPEEKERITQLGGMIVFGRLFGTLAISRGFGDKEFKAKDKMFVSNQPYVSSKALTKKDQFIILGCDGLWDRVTYKDAVDFVFELLAQKKSPEEISAALCKLALDRGSLDNVTAIVVLLSWS